MKKFIFSNWIWGITLSLLTLFFYFTGTGLDAVESKFYDFRSKLKADNLPKTEIAIIEIDDESISKIGRWPWPRTKISDMIVWLSSAPAKPSVIGLNILFSEPERNDSVEVANLLKQKYIDLVETRQIKEKSKESEFLGALEKIKENMDKDAELSRTIENAGNVVLPMFMQTSNLMAKPQEAPAWIKNFALKMDESQSLSEFFIESGGITSPLEIFSSSAAGIGHVNVFSERDGAVRKEYPFIAHNLDFFPSFAFEVVRNHLKRKSSEITIVPGESINIGKYAVPLDASSSMLISFNNSETAFKTYSFYDVLNGKVVPEAFRNKIVLIGPTAQGIGTLYVTPLQKNLPAATFTANIIENILHNNYVTRPAWAFQAELALIFLMSVFITLILPRLKAIIGAILAGILLAGLVGAGVFMFITNGEWLKITHPSFLLISGYIFVISKRFFTTEKSKELIEVSAIETNKMLGLSFQGQGMLDLSFQKFRLCPLDDAMKDLLYNLALDFERKRQFNKAVAVYEHIYAKDAKYKDIKIKIENLKKASDGAVFGGSLAGPSKDSTILVDGSSATPTLGRYEISKELGKGAMGIVYLGKDPQINRQVAIKTLRFEEGVEEDQLKALKERFFREAQAAGNLSHPSIIKIYDAGEDQEIAYMAIELLNGEDLKTWTPKKNLLPMEKTLEYMYKSADALDYAHKNGVIHRDIKPANIMLLEDGNIRVVDFGIARIQESSKTATGTVLGTPYYMSPEQIAGKKVDGRADIFSLGVTMFELLTGEKPWKGGDAVGTLFFQIAKDPYPDPLSIRPDLPKGILPVINKALQKNPDERYLSAGKMAEDIKAVMENRTPTNTGTSSEKSSQNAVKPNAAPESKPIAPKPAQTTVVPNSSKPVPVQPIEDKPKPAPAPVQKPVQAPQQQAPVPTPLKPIDPKPAPVQAEKPVQTQQPSATLAPAPAPGYPQYADDNASASIQKLKTPLDASELKTSEETTSISEEKTPDGISSLQNPAPSEKESPVPLANENMETKTISDSNIEDARKFGEGIKEQMPLSEALGQPAPDISNAPINTNEQKAANPETTTFEKTLPLIYPGDEKENKQ